MSLDDRERRQIADIVIMVIDAKLDNLRKEIIAGFVEALDWHNDNFAKIMAQTNQATVSELTKKQREVIEIRTRDDEERRLRDQAEAEKSARRGFTAKG